MYEVFFAVLIFDDIVSSVRLPLMPIEVDFLNPSKGLFDTADGQLLQPTNFYKRSSAKTSSQEMRVVMSSVKSDHHVLGSRRNMQIGSPFQSFRVLLDTSTSLSYVTMAGPEAKKSNHCEHDELSVGCNGQPHKLSNERNRYSSEKSETGDRYKLPVPYMEKKLTPGTYIATDVICLGKLCAKRTPFVLKSKDDKDIAALPCDGVLGLAHQTASDFLLMPVVQKLCSEDKTTEHSFTVWTKDDIRAGQIAGFLTIGGNDTEHCEEDYQVLQVQRAKHWEFFVQQIIVQNMAIRGNHGKPLRAIMNSRQNLIAARPEIIDKLVAHFKAKERKDGYHVDCNHILSLQMIKFDVSLENDNDTIRFLVLYPHDYVFKIGDNCLLAFTKNRKVLDADLEFGNVINKKFCQTYKYGNGADEEQVASIVLARKKIV